MRRRLEVGGGEVVVYGHWGRPLLACPSERGAATDWEDRGMLDETLVGGSLSLSYGSSGLPVELHIIRQQSSGHVALTANGHQLGLTSRFKTTGTGLVRISVNNGSNNVVCTTNVVGLTIRSNALIGGRLVQNKTDFSTHRIVAEVPEARLTDVGEQDIIIFGPWGTRSLPSGFTYTLPTGRTLGRDASSTFTTFDDSTLKDG